MFEKSNENGLIAVVGMAFRFPGDTGNEAELWQALQEGRDLVTQIDYARWDAERLQHPKPSEPGRSKTFAAGVLSRVDEFDASFFGISPREAAWLDPQQRLLLELAWESLENGGIAPASIAGSGCSVFVGISGLDYGMRAISDLSSMSSHSMTGNTFSIAANRLSYVFDLHGPSLAVDTACSSSLVALHQACNSLRTGESSMALVAGVNLLLHPYPFVGFTKASMLSPNGRCRAFDAAGNGYVRGEGGAVLLLKPLDQALADGNVIEAVILATGANADGGRKTGLTIPSCEGQAELMRAVLSRSGLSAHDIDYIEAHGTGTAVGDPIESAAIGKAYGQSRQQGDPLPIGSVKTNLGHLEAASGMAGLVKSILVLKNRALPPSLHFVTPNPRIDFSGLNIEVVTDYRPMAESPFKKMVVGVNSFGFGGANAHVLLQEFCSTKEAAAHTDVLTPPLFLSARTPQALRELAGRYAQTLEQQPQSCYDIAYGAALRRDRMEARLALKGSDAAQMVQQLRAFSQNEAAPQLVLENALAQPGGVAFIYSGNGSQWLGMGQKLLAESPRFTELMQALDASMLARAGFSVVAQLQAEPADSLLEDTAVAQPLLFAMQVALTTMLRELGIEAQAVAGHSVGEVAAAWAAGALSLDQAIEVICARSAAQALTRGTGRMAAVGLSHEAALALIAGEKLLEIEIAGINSPNNVTLCGPLAVLERLGDILAKRGVFFRLLDLDYAFHSRAMDPIQQSLTAQLAPLTPGPCASAVFVSTVTGNTLNGADLGADYWWRNVRQPVRFMQAIATLTAAGCKVFLEIGPHAILQRYISECLTAGETTGRVLSTLRRGDDGLTRLEEAALRAHLLVEPHRLNVFFPTPGQAIKLPNYPWQRERHWHPRTSESDGLLDNRRVHPLLGWRLKDTAAAWENVLDTAVCPWLADHKVANAIVLPGSGYVEMALAAAREHFGGTVQEIEEIDILAPIVFDGDHARSLRFELSVRDGGFQIRSRQRLSEDEWTLNAVGRLLGAPVGVQPTNTVKPPLASADAVLVDHPTHYQLTEALGLGYGPAFRGFDHAVVEGQTLLAALHLPQSVGQDAGRYCIHPALLDVCFQSLVDFFQASIEAGQGLPLLPVKLGRLRHLSSAPITQFRACLKRQSARSVLADFELLDATGGVVALLEDCRFRAASVQRRKQVAPAFWQTVPRLQPLATQQLQSKLASSIDLAQQLNTWFSDSEPKLDRSRYIKDAQPLFEALALAFARDTFLELFGPSGDQLQPPLEQAEAMDAKLRPLFLSMVRALREDGLLVEQASGAWQLDTADLPPAQDIWRTLLRDYPAALPELVLTARVGRHLAQLLKGKGDTSALVQSLRQSHQIETLFDDSPAYLGTRLAIQQALQTVASQWPGHRRLRVLEVIAGASALVQPLTEAFPQLQLDYVIAHASEDAHAHLCVEYAGHPFVVVARIEEEGLELVADAKLPDHFDVIIFRHTLHRASHPAGVLAAARRRLAGGGLLIVAERYPDAAANFMFGLDPAWWRPAGQGAELASCLTTPVAWEASLSNQGFVDVAAYQEPASAGLSAGAYLMLAKRPEEDVLAATALPAATWLLLCDAAGPSHLLAENLCSRLKSQGHGVLVRLVGHHAPVDREQLLSPEDPLFADALLALSGSESPRPDHVVYLAGLGTEPLCSCAMPPAGGPLAAPADVHVIGITHLVQALARANLQPRLWLLAAGGALVEGLSRSQAPAMQQGAVWGLGRVVMNEYPALSCTLIDLDLDPGSDEAGRQLQEELLSPNEEREIVLTARGRFGLRMERMPAALPERPATKPRFKLDFRVPGQLRNLLWLPQPERVLAPADVEVRVVATGLNFRDVMYLMGLLPDEAVENGFAGANLGLEFSGVVTRVGKPGGEFSVGDAVMGFGSACFSSHVVTQATALTLKPADWSFEAAATVPTVFFTVYYALKQLANLQPGERVLIHGAAGGVGIAAVQMALHLGAEIYATVGSEEKRDFVSLLGADHVFDSRSLAFADDILAITGGEGVDVVLNSLAGEAIRRNLRVLKPFGRFLELGKRDFFENTPIGLRLFKDNISYFGIDADQLLSARPALAGRLFREVMALFREGVLFPLPYRVFSADHVVDAFRAMQQARQIGKVVVVLDGAQVAVEPAQAVAPKVVFDQNAAWLVTGGLSGFGLESARWLAERGAKRLVLTGRRGADTPGAAQAVQALEAMGVHVEVVACDIADPAAVQSMLADIRRNGAALTGILHAAMVLDDALMANLDANRMRQVLAPKMAGAWHLHSLTLDMPLEHFVLYSSVTTSIGNPGQANYVAANASLESLAALRHSLGLPATCIGWGPIGDAGYLTRNQAVKDSLSARLGAEPLLAHQALGALDRLLTSGTTPPTAVTTVANFEWSALSRLLPSVQAPRFESLQKQAGPASDASADGQDIHSLIAGKSAAEVRAIIQALVTSELAQVLCVGADRIDPTRSLHDLGMDSLMGVELALGLEKRFGIQLPAMMLSEGPSVERVASRIVDRVMGGTDAAEPAADDGMTALVAQLAAQHGEDISDLDMAQMAADTRENATAREAIS